MNTKRVLFLLAASLGLAAGQTNAQSVSNITQDLANSLAEGGADQAMSDGTADAYMKIRNSRQLNARSRCYFDSMLEIEPDNETQAAQCRKFRQGRAQYLRNLRGQAGQRAGVIDTTRPGGQRAVVTGTTPAGQRAGIIDTTRSGGQRAVVTGSTPAGQRAGVIDTTRPGGQRAVITGTTDEDTELRNAIAAAQAQVDQREARGAAMWPGAQDYADRQTSGEMQLAAGAKYRDKWAANKEYIRGVMAGFIRTEREAGRVPTIDTFWTPAREKAVIRKFNNSVPKNVTLTTPQFNSIYANNLEQLWNVEMARRVAGRSQMTAAQAGRPVGQRAGQTATVTGGSASDELDALLAGMGGSGVPAPSSNEPTLQERAWLNGPVKNLIQVWPGDADSFGDFYDRYGTQLEGSYATTVGKKSRVRSLQLSEELFEVLKKK
jgi:hypothetical protein